MARDTAKLILVINPGSTSTKTAIFCNGNEAHSTEIACSREELAALPATFDQLPLRLRQVNGFLAGAGVAVNDLAAIAARGAPLAPVPGGTYRINDAMLADARSDHFLDHVSRLGCIIANALAQPHGIPAFIVDPISVDEYDEIARISGSPLLGRKSMTHALNIRATAWRFAAEQSVALKQARLIIAHLGGGISIAALQDGRMIDSVDANGEGPMSPERSGGLRVDSVIDLCYSGKFSHNEIRKLLTKGSGLAGHLGVVDAREVERRITKGDAQAKLVYAAMAYQVAKHIAALAAVLHGKVDAVILTGGLAKSTMLVELISARTSFIAPVKVYAGENEIKALYEGAARVLNGLERARVYPTGKEET